MVPLWQRDNYVFKLFRTLSFYVAQAIYNTKEGAIPMKRMLHKRVQSAIISTNKKLSFVIVIEMIVIVRYSIASNKVLIFVNLQFQ